METFGSNDSVLSLPIRIELPFWLSLVLLSRPLSPFSSFISPPFYRSLHLYVVARWKRLVTRFPENIPTYVSYGLERPYNVHTEDPQDGETTSVAMRRTRWWNDELDDTDARIFLTG